MDDDMERLVIELAETMRSRFFGKYRGLVQSVEDDGPDSLGRIIAKVPEVFNDQDSPLALPSVPFAGKNHGLVALPEKGDGVWIEFEGGDPSRPIWSGFWWASNEIPSPGAQKTRALVTSGGHKIILDDDKKELKLLHSGGASLTFTDNDITLKIGSTQIVLSAQGVNVNKGALEVK